MPCPLFEPQRKIESLEPAAGRLPLFFEFEGICHAQGGAPGRSPACNLGYPGDVCTRFPSDFPISAVRFQVIEKFATCLRVLVIEDLNHWPRDWKQITFDLGDHRLEPEIEDLCRRAQVLSFCLSYLEKF